VEQKPNHGIEKSLFRAIAFFSNMANTPKIFNPAAYLEFRTSSLVRPFANALRDQNGVFPAGICGTKASAVRLAFSSIYGLWLSLVERLVREKKSKRPSCAWVNRSLAGTSEVRSNGVQICSFAGRSYLKRYQNA
jgi:hypothetical protein